MERRFLKLRNPESVNEGCSKFVRYRRRAITMKRFQKSKQNRKQKANMESLKEDMKKISEQQQRIKDGQMDVRRSFEEIESQCDQLNKETSLIWRQTLYNQQRICLIFKILKAREDNNFSMVAELTQFLSLTNTRATTMNSTSAVKSATNSCFFEDHDITSELNNNRKPEVLFLLFKSSA